MHAGGARDAEPRDGFLHDARAFLLGELGEGFVFQARDGQTFVVIAHPAFEGRESAAGHVAHSRCNAAVSSGAVLNRNAFIRRPPEE